MIPTNSLPLSLLLLLSPLAHSQSPPAPFTRTLFLDNFTTYPPTLQQPTTSKWSFSLGTSYPGGPPRWGTNEIQSYTSSPSNINVTSPRNTLTITPLKLPSGQWTSSRLECLPVHDFSCAPGAKIRVEASLRFGSSPAAQQKGIWPSFWLLGADFRGNYRNWPAVGEVDIAESISGQPTLWQVLHCGTAPGGACNEYEGVWNTVSGFTRRQNEFHTVAVEIDRTNSGGDWRGERLSWWVDGRKTFEVDGGRVRDERAWTAVTRGSKFVILNVAVGGDFPDNVANEGGGKTPTTETKGGEGAEMEVRYVAVYST
ncbi:glucan endo-1,3-beta-glucosidase A1-like protein [Triangularia verruculosa]|uniref:Glucan endo-1,3-beta-glucosidase A1-like protein n=1 Tax=Triangularia verruculosa TaxID=2587418 RepID=A0AAN7AS67_9PEZI|nr:glucan endo-1,3-beta-glucosidase A1-like protein [Triangularia verruculosa]